MNITTITNASISIYEHKILFIHAELDDQDIETLSYLGRGCMSPSNKTLMYEAKNDITIFLWT